MKKKVMIRGCAKTVADTELYETGREVKNLIDWGCLPEQIKENGILSDKQEELLIKRLTEVSSEIMKVPQEFFVTTIKEVSDKNFGIGGKTIDKVKEEYINNNKKKFCF